MPEREVADFIRCWNDGMPTERMAARFCIARTTVLERARLLRRKGRDVLRRLPNPRLDG